MLTPTASANDRRSWISLFWPKPPKGGSGIRLPNGLLFLCHAIRLAVVVLLAWRLWLIAYHSLDTDGIVMEMKNWAQIDISGVTDLQIYGLCLLNIIIKWGLQVGIYASLFQLFTGFIRGDVFAPETGIRLRRAGLFCMAYIVAAPLRSFLAMALLTAHLPEGTHWTLPTLYPGPLYDFILGATGVVLGQVFKVAAELARENAEII